MARILAGWFEPASVEGLARRSVCKPPVVSFGHGWAHLPASRVWICRVCSLAAKERSESPCPGCFKLECGFGPRHQVVRAWLEGEHPFFFCRLCGAHGSWRWKGLHTTCPGEVESAVQRHVLKMLLLGFHPRTRQPLERYANQSPF